MSALAIRILACVTMLLDHIGYHFYYAMPEWAALSLRAVGRLAFPLFVFLIINGYRHTACRWKYLLRLVIFALISQVPYALLIHNNAAYPEGNVLFTLALSLACVYAADALWQHKGTRWCAFLPALVLFLLFFRGVLHADYGAKGILLAFLFRYCDSRKPLSRLLLPLGMLLALYHAYLYGIVYTLLFLLLGRDAAFPTLGSWSLMQLFSLLALPVMYLYNGKKGRLPQNRAAAKGIQLGFYAFYPLHMLLLYFL